MSVWARGITTTTTTTSSAASSRLIGGGDDGDDGVVLTERIGSDEGGGTMLFRGGGAVRMPIRSQRYESVGTADGRSLSKNLRRLFSFSKLPAFIYLNVCICVCVFV